VKLTSTVGVAAAVCLAFGASSTPYSLATPVGDRESSRPVYISQPQVLQAAPSPLLPARFRLGSKMPWPLVASTDRGRFLIRRNGSVVAFPRTKRRPRTPPGALRVETIPSAWAEMSRATSPSVSATRSFGGHTAYIP
jgi:hypothetical protein